MSNLTIQDVIQVVNTMNAGAGAPAPATAPAVAPIGHAKKPDFNWDSLDACIRQKDPRTGFDLLETNGKLSAGIKVVMTTAWSANGFGAIKWDWDGACLKENGMDDPKAPKMVNEDLRDALVEDVIPMLLQLRLDTKATAKTARKNAKEKAQSGYGEAGCEADIV